ncbi:MAG: hypothetical protein AABW52_02310, partial [Nanoarchaeota archaeon]
MVKITYLFVLFILFSSIVTATSSLNDGIIVISGKGNTIQTVYNEVNTPISFNYNNATGTIIASDVNITLSTNAELFIYNVSFYFNGTAGRSFNLTSNGNLTINYTKFSLLNTTVLNNITDIYYYFDIQGGSRLNVLYSNITSIGSSVRYGTSSDGININTNHTIIKNSLFYGWKYTDEYLLNFAGGINHTFQNNTIHINSNGTKIIILSALVNNSNIIQNNVNISSSITTPTTILQILGQNNTISNNTIYGMADYGIELNGAKNTTITNNTIDVFGGINNSLYLQSSSDSNIIYNNKFLSNVVISNSAYNNITANDFNITKSSYSTFSSRPLAFILSSSNNSKVSYNNFTTTTGIKIGDMYAMVLDSALRNEINFNRINITENQTNPILLMTGTNYTSIDSNLLWTNSTRQGIAIFSESSNNTISNNNVTITSTTAASGNSGSVIIPSSAINNSIYGNRIESNITASGECITLTRSLITRVFNNTFGICPGSELSIGAGSNNSIIYYNTFTGRSKVKDTGNNNTWNLSSSNGGGNRWKNFDKPIEECIDNDYNTYCDIPLNISNSSGSVITNDYLPIYNVSLRELNITADSSSLTLDSDVNGTYSLNIINTGDENETLILSLLDPDNLDTKLFNTTNITYTLSLKGRINATYVLPLTIGSFTEINYTTMIKANSTTLTTVNSSLNITTSISLTLLLQNLTWQTNLTGIYKGSVITGDIDNNGYNDVIIFGDRLGCTDYEKNITADCFGKVFTNNKTSLLTNTNWSINITPLAFSSGVLGDIDRDNDSDLIVIGRNAQTLYTQVYINNGTSFAENTVWEMNLTKVYSGTAILGYVNNDQLLDLFITGCNATSCTNVYSAVYTNNGTSFIYNLSYSSNITSGGFSSAAFIDAENDNDNDLLVTGCGTVTGDTGEECTNGFTHFYQNNGTAYNINMTWGPEFFQGGLGTLGLGDIDNDKDIDIYWTGFDSGESSLIHKVYQ